MSARFAGKVAIVTGGGNGIGLAIAMRFAAEGALAVIADVNPAAGTRAADEIAGLGGRAVSMTVDVADEPSVERLVDDVVMRHGPIDILVNNAGIVVHKLIVDMGRAEWDRMLAVQTTGPFLMSKHVARHMIERGGSGRIVNISSLAGTVGRVRGAAHCVSKAGLNLLTQVLAMELAPHGINVNSVAPGLIDVPAQREERTLSLAYRNSYVDMIPFGRMGQPGDVASAVLFLCSEDAAWITGEQLRVDGGTMAGHFALGEQHDHVGPVGHT